MPTNAQVSYLGGPEERDLALDGVQEVVNLGVVGHVEQDLV